ncbi:MAG TPA: hypothetical protein VE954_21555 [Oligoflexus sp.]|uniref:hypothetical protein n=1 Tax=Oligoflexus sp. TaxID=1971216 RepID=UPI002D3DA99A|nr:hypothetical protein [Oligoflexus sp.]HYX35691.1 hypothetical protein [Oligoflexus sp.]
MMKLSAKCVLLSASAVAMPALAQEQGAAFENFLLSSPSIVSPSQYYQVKGGRFEALAGLVNGTADSKPATSEADISGQNLAAGYAQALSSQLVLGADVHYVTSELENAGAEFTGSETEIKPTVAFSLNPMFSLGASINIISGEDEAPAGSESYSYNTFTVGATVHQDLWEASLALTTSNEDEDKPNANAAQTISLHGRYKIMPVLALGLVFDQADYGGIEGPTQTLETETTYGVILESAVSDNSRVEVAFLSVGNESGNEDSDATQIFLSGGFDLAPAMELGGQLAFSSGESDTSEYSFNSYALTLSMHN